MRGRKTEEVMMSTEVAETIIAQLGGNHFVVMTGARHLLADGNTLTFRLPSNFAKNGINAVSVRLNGRDLYDVAFSRVRGIRSTVITEHHDVYSDSLHEIFTSATGLDTTL
jgi:riboflavin biosynthesis pyrimidine reductase